MSEMVLMKSTELSVIRWARVNSMDPEWLANLVEEIRKRYLNVFSFDYRRAKSLYLTYKRLCEVMEEDFAVSCEKVDVDEVYAEEYKKILVEVIDNSNVPILFNVNIGHATPRCIIPFGVEATVNAREQIIRFAD